MSNAGALNPSFPRGGNSRQSRSGGLSSALFASALGATTLLGGRPAYATVYYVSADRGSDQAAGNSPDASFRSLAHAADRLGPGDTLIIASGRYTAPLQLSKSGTASAPIVIKGGDGARPEIVTAEDAVTISADYVEVSRIDAHSIGDLGSAFVIQHGHHHIKILDVVAHDSGCGGIGGLQTDYVTIRHSRVFGNGARSPWQCSGISLYQATNVDDAPGFHNVISGNIVYGNQNKVPDPKLPASLSGHTTDGNGIIVDDFRHTQPSQQKTPPYRAATLIENNLVYDNGGRGIEAFYSDGVTIVGNTSVHNGLDPLMLKAPYGSIYVAFASDVGIFNNLVQIDESGVPAVMVAKATKVEADYNVIVGPGSSIPIRQSDSQVALGVHNASETSAGFVDEKNRDLHLTAESLVRGKGSSEHASAHDLDGRARAKTGAIDPGAYQYR